MWFSISDVSLSSSGEASVLQIQASSLMMCSVLQSEWLWMSEFPTADVKHFVIWFTHRFLYHVLMYFAFYLFLNTYNKHCAQHVTSYIPYWCSTSLWTHGGVFSVLTCTRSVKRCIKPNVTHPSRVMFFSLDTELSHT